MAKPSKTAKLVITSIILSLVVLIAFAVIFMNYIIPAYQITNEQMYSILVRLFPILIGLVLIQIGVSAGRRGEEDYKDTIDKLSPNQYDSSLYSPAKDDPSIIRGPETRSFEKEPEFQIREKEVIKEVPVEVVKEVIKEVPVEVVREVPVEVVSEVPVEIIREVQVPVEVKVPVEVIKEVEKEVPVEVIREVPVEIVREIEKEVPVEVVRETIKEVPVEVVKEVVKEVPVEVVKEVPVEIVKESVKEVPVELIKEVPIEVIKEVQVPVEVVKEVKVPVAAEAEKPARMEDRILSFREALDIEKELALHDNYDLSLVGIKNRTGLTEDAIECSFGEDTLVFSENGCFYAILPLYNRKEAEEITKDLEPRTVATLSGRSISADAFIKEATI